MRITAHAIAILFFITLVTQQALAQKNDDGRLLQLKELPQSAKRYALVIGVDKYDDDKLTTLNGATNDATTLADTLQKYAGFPADQIVLLTNNQPPERQPKRNIILAKLSNLIAAAKRDQGLLLISFAGHGIERGGKPFLLSSDAQLGNELDIDLLEDTAISVTKMKERLKGLDQVLLILDACRNNPTTGRGDKPNPLSDGFMRGFNFDTKNREVKAFATLYATLPGQVSYEYKEKQQGYFTYALVEALRGNVPGLANNKGEITLGRLIAYLQERVPKMVALNGGRQQQPHLVMEGYKPDELVISVTININLNSNTNNSSSSNNSNNSATNNDLSVELEFWRSVQNSNNPNELREYLKSFPNGKFTALAKERLARLTSGEDVTRVDKPARIITPETIYGLSDYMEQIYRLMRDGERAKARVLIQEFLVPDYQNWFKEVFGSVNGPQLTLEYSKLESIMLSELTAFFDKMVAQGQTSARVIRLSGPTDPNAVGNQKKQFELMHKPIALYSVRMVKPGDEFGNHIYSFVYVNGGFRLLGKTGSGR